MQKRFALDAKQTIAVGFAFIILMGAFLLTLPISNRNGVGIPFLNALFTATSATCVTGLVVYDTWSQFSFFGQVIILMLIQIGGLGFMTVAILFSMVLRRRIGLKERTFLMEAVNSMHISGVVRLVRHILIGTLLFEAVGALLLTVSFYPDMGLKQSIWFGIFHSVSAFCNAGFDLMGFIEPYTSLVPYASHKLVNFTVMGLIVIGGIGFIVWKDLMTHKWHWNQYKLHTKATLVATGLLITVSALAFFFLEKNHAFAQMNVADRVLASFFQAVTPRTAGFNTVDNGALSEGGAVLTMVLMFVGGAPGSTAGGIKVTTLVLLLLSVLASSRNREDVTLFKRRIPDGQIRRAYSNTMLYMLLAFAGCMILLVFQPFTIRDALFETLSALGTVGLSTGITRDLGPVSRIAIILLMYSGRLGSLTLFMAVAEKKNRSPLRDPEEKIIIG